MVIRPTVTLSDSGPARQKQLMDSLGMLTHQSVLVGIPSTTAVDRQNQILGLLGAAKGKRRKANLAKAASLMINNAQLVFVHTHGSPLHHIPARPIIEAAIEDPENQKLIVAELALAADAAFAGNEDEVTRQLKKAGLMAENLVRAWFTNPRNGWAPNAPSTIAQKGSSRPLIDTTSMRKAITSVTVKD